MLIFKLGWYLIYTKPKHEKRTAKELLELDLDVYLPLVNQDRKLHDRTKTIQSPMFPSYIFVKLSNIKDLYKAAQVSGFVCYVRLGKQIATIRESVIDDLRRLLVSEREVELCNGHFPVGREVTIPTGPFAGIKCEVVYYNGGLKVLVRMEVLSRSVLINISKDLLSKN